MIYIKSFGLLHCAALALCLTSCGGNGAQKTSGTDSSAADTSKIAMAPGTIVSTPELIWTVRHKVANYAKWKMVYDAHDSTRMKYGLHNYVIGRSLSDSNMILVGNIADDTAKAMAFKKDPGLKMAMQKGGVTGAPMFSMMTATWQDTVTIQSKVRARTTFAVKDWETWQKAFMEGKQERLDNGITDRVIGHDVNDTKKVTIVTAIIDSAKANAYYKSDALKKRREASGVIGEPDRFIFEIVQRYH